MKYKRASVKNKKLKRSIKMFDFGLTKEQEDRARRLHEESIIIDMLDASKVNEDYFRFQKKGGITVASHTVIKEVAERSRWGYEATVAGLAEWHDIFRSKADKVVHVTSVDDIRRAKAAGKLGIILNFQNTACLNDDIERVDLFNKLGVWVVQLTYNYQGLIGGGCLERGDYGLSEFGIKVVRRMNELGMVVDTAHCGHATMMDAIEFSEKPVACTHCNLKALCNTPRCRSDEELKVLASKGGVLGLNNIPGFMCETGRCTINDYLDQVDYAVKLMGIDHVGIGTDFVTGTPADTTFDSEDWGEGGRRLADMHLYREIWPPQIAHQGFEDESKFPNVTRGLVARGYKDDEIAKILGGNWMRLLEEVRS